MNKTLNIVILDEDKFYTAGLAMMLTMYLKNRGQKAEFFSNHTLGKTTDIVFQAIRCGTFIAPHSSTCTNNDKPLYVAIAEERMHICNTYTATLINPTSFIDTNR